MSCTQQQSPQMPHMHQMPQMPFYQVPYQPGMTPPQTYPFTHRPPQEGAPMFPVYRGPMVPPGEPFREGPPTTTDIGYMPAFLRTQIGMPVKVEFLIGTNLFIDKVGTLVAVGINYIILQETKSFNYVVCDMYSIKFVTIYPENDRR